MKSPKVYLNILKLLIKKITINIKILEKNTDYMKYDINISEINKDNNIIQCVYIKKHNSKRGFNSMKNLWYNKNKVECIDNKNNDSLNHNILDENIDKNLKNKMHFSMNYKNKEDISKNNFKSLSKDIIIDNKDGIKKQNVNIVVNDKLNIKDNNIEEINQLKVETELENIKEQEINTLNNENKNNNIIDEKIKILSMNNNINSMKDIKLDKKIIEQIVYI